MLMVVAATNRGVKVAWQVSCRFVVFACLTEMRTLATFRAAYA